MAQRVKRQISLLAAALAVAILLAASAGLPAAGRSVASDSESASEQVDKEFTVWAKQFSYEPAVIEVQQGDRVRINLKSADVEHGFYIDSYEVNVKVNVDAPQSVEFVADKAGTFKIRCSIACGPFHPFMAGKFVVWQNFNYVPWAMVVGTAVVAVVSLGIPAYLLWRRNKANGNS